MESDYDLKFDEMKKYIPFLESMIRRLETTTVGPINPRQAQLSKIRALRDLLLDRSKRMKMENLLKCEQVLVNLYAKVESRDTLPGIQKAPGSVSISPSRTTNDLDIARRKLKVTVLATTDPGSTEDTLPEIARANQAEVDCSPGSKEPALFQRRPNKGESSQFQEKSLYLNSKRNYTRLLVSPPRPSSQQRWPSTDKSPEKLFHRRSPKKSPRKSSPSRKKERKKSSRKESNRTRKHPDNLNITLQVPEESLNSLRTEDIFERIINCDNTDVDIATLRELRSQILGELKQTTANEDISDLILKSYRKNQKKVTKNVDVEEGELSDSESEAIENIYGSLVIVDNENETKDTNIVTIAGSKDSIKSESRKIQICLVISNNDKDKLKEKPTSESSTKTNLVNTNVVEVKGTSENKTNEHFEEVVPTPKPKSFDSPFNNFDLSSDYVPKVNPGLQIDSAKTESYKTESDSKNNPCDTEKDTNVEIEQKHDFDKLDVEVTIKDDKKDTKIIEEKITDDIENKANFYKPLAVLESSIVSPVKNTPKLEKPILPTPEEYLKGTDNEMSNLNLVDTHPKIPFLSEPSPGCNPPSPSKGNNQSVSEIDILQALKNEILSETIAIPGAEIITPPLHHPKILTKVANVQDIAIKKKISLENYKQKSSVRKHSKTIHGKVTDDLSQKQSRGLTAKEFERFKLMGLGIDTDSSDDDAKKDLISLEEVYGDLAPHSPDFEIASDKGSDSPVIIPEEPLATPVVLSTADVDMRALMPKSSPKDVNLNKESAFKGENALPRQVDPRKRKDNPSNNDDMSKPLIHKAGNSTPMQNFPNVTPSRTPSMTPNARTFEMTPSYNCDYDDQSSYKKHVYAPAPGWETNEREKSIARDNKNSIRWETNDRVNSNPRWETNNLRSGSAIRDVASKSSPWESARDPRSNRDEPSDQGRYNNRDLSQRRPRDPRLNHERRDDSFGRLECPATPSHYFGRGDYPTTPSHPFGRSEGSMTPLHAFGRSDVAPSTPLHPFGRSEIPASTPCHPFGSGESTPIHSFGRSDMPMTPSHPFGRSDYSSTPSHPFGRSDCPATPTHAFGRSECPNTPSHPFGRSGFSQDLRRSRRSEFEDDKRYNKDRHSANYNRNNYRPDKPNRPYTPLESHEKFSRDPSVGRNEHRSFTRDHSIGRCDLREPYAGRQYIREPSVGRQRETSVGRHREPSIGRQREPSVGQLSKSYSDPRRHSDNFKKEFRIGSESSRDFKDIVPIRERSVGRTVSVESHAGRSFTIDTSINTTFQAFKSDDVFDSRRIRASSVGRTLVQERKILPEVISKLKVDRNRAKFKRAQSVGRDVAENVSNRSFNDIKADFESYRVKTVLQKTKKLEKNTDDRSNMKFSGQKISPSSHKELKNTLKILEYEAPKPQRHPRSRRSKFEVQQENNKTKKETYSPRKNHRDPRIRNANESLYNKSGSNSKDKEAKKSFGIVYTNDNIAKGNILGPGAGVKNYKIPKIKRPQEENIEKESEDSNSKNDDEDKEKSCQVKKSPDNDANILKKDSAKNKATSTKKESNNTLKTRKNALDTSSISSDENTSSPVRPRRSRKAVVYDDSDDENEEKNKTEIKSNLPVENNEENNSLDFSFGIEDEDIDIFTDNMASDTVIDNINDLLANLDKDIDPSKSDEGIITEANKNDIFDNILRSLTDDKLIPESVQDDSLTKQIENTEASMSNTQDKINICDKKEEIETSVSLKEPDVKDFLNSNVQEDSVHNEVGSTSIAEEHNIGDVVPNITQNAVATSEVCSTPDSTINNEDNSIPANVVQDTPDSTDSSHADVNCDITSTHDPAEQSSINITTERHLENVSPKIDPYEEILSFLQDKSKVKKLLGNLDPTDEKLKKKLEKLIDIVSDGEDETENTLSEKVQTDKVESIENEEHKNPIQEKLSQDQEKLVEADELKTDKNFVILSSSIENAVKQKEIKQTSVITESTKEDKNNMSDQNEKVLQKMQSSNDEEDNESLMLISKHSSKKFSKKPKVVLKKRSAVNKVKPVKNKKTVFKKRLTRSSHQKKDTLKKQIPSNSDTQTSVSRKGRVKKTELHMLQEDIRDMFISNEVLNATGIRMCRLAKLVDDKSTKDISNDTSPSKTNESSNKSEDEIFLRQPTPVVVLEKKNLELFPPKPKGKKRGRKPAIVKTNSVTEKYPTEKKPGPKSKTKPQANRDSVIDPYEFESDSFSETTKNYENTSVNSDSDNESMVSSKSFNSTDLLVEQKPKTKRKRGGWQTGVIKPRKGKKKNQKSDSTPIEKEHSLENDSRITRYVKVPDMNCFTDMNYCFVKNAIAYGCRLCHFEGDSIVHHYKKQHPHYEIPLSRMLPQIAKDAINQSMVTNFKEISKVSVTRYACRFCGMAFDDKRTVILEAFFWHVVSTHTGEYKQLCSECTNIKPCPFMLDIPPPPTNLKGLLMGYICGKCNYTQVSLENLKNHVSLRHNDDETEVFTISLSTMTKKAVELLKMKANEDCPRSLRSRTTNNSEVSDEQSDAAESDGKRSDSEKDLKKTTLKRMTPRSVKSRLNFESDLVSDTDHLDTIVKSETDEREDVQNDLDDPSDDRGNDPALNLQESMPKTDIVLPPPESTVENRNRKTFPEVFSQPHFKLRYTESGSKEYSCCINGDNHYKTSLLISMKKHVQTKHSQDAWDGFCAMCKVIVMPQGVHSFKECLTHLLDNHIDNFPLLETEESPVVHNDQSMSTEDLVETKKNSSKTYINVRPITELLSDTVQPKVTESAPEQEVPVALPKIASVMSLNYEAANSTETPPVDTMEISVQSESALPKVVNYEEVMRDVITKKHRIVLQAMMSTAKLAHIFKCAGRYCSFTCSSVENSLLHASTHQRIGGADALSCTYCSFDASGNAIDLVSHVFKDHGNCKFACQLCFYRAFSSPLVEAHYHRVHNTSKTVVVLQSSAASSMAGTDNEGLLSRPEAVKHYVCLFDQEKCKFRTFTMIKFNQHFDEKHPDATYYPCNQCPYVAMTNPNELVRHLKTHDINLYQCTWCIFGADTENEMLLHASLKHPTKRPQAYLRHILETRDESSVPKFKVLPFVHITKKNVVPPVEVTASGKTEDAVKEAERALELEKLLGLTTPALADFPDENSPVEARVTCVEPEEPTDIPMDMQPNQQLENTDEAASTSADPPPPTPCTPPPSALPEQLTPILKKEITDEPSSDKNNSDVVYCLDSDEEAKDELVSTPSAVKLSDRTQSNEHPSNATEINKTAKIIRVPLFELFKCGKCSLVAKSENMLRRHFSKCYEHAGPHISCAFCEALFQKSNTKLLVNHYIKEHGPVQRYSCGICHYADVDNKAVRKHLGTVHNISVVSFRQKSDDLLNMEFVSETQVESTASKPRAKRKRSSNELPAAAPSKQRRYGPEDIKLLPINQIFDELTQCSLCEFSTKVRQNMIRHLQLHSQQQSVPQIAPVNPVPHLETNEMHFDRMVNLASSSVASKQSQVERERASRAAPTPGPEPEPAVAVTLLIPVEAAARYPRYVPERARYTCGALGCSYTSIDEAMLRCHWDTLHAGARHYRCVHCPANQQLDTSRPLTAARILAHLKMHDARLFACSLCAYYHHQPHVVDKHLAERHAGKGQVRAVRGPAAPAAPPLAASATPVASAASNSAPTMDLKPWQCGLCKFKSMLRPEVIDHCSKTHQSKFQYKCAFCPWRSSAMENVTKHHSNSHAGQKGDVFYFYYREGDVPDEADGTPRWMKQRQKTPEVKKEDDSSPPDAEVPTPTPVVTKPPEVDLNIVKNEVVEEKSQRAESTEDLCKKFGVFCEPNGIRYMCSLCKLASEDTKEAMQSHLFEELKYRKWGCRVCSYRAFHKQGLKEHAIREHRQNLEPIEMSTDHEIENWVLRNLEHQEEIIKQSLDNFHKQHIVTPEKEPPKRNEITPFPIVEQTETGSKKASMQDLEKAFGPFGAPCNMLFSCPKCDFKVKDESKMNEHLESELSKVRWTCSHCTECFFQHFHQAQLHCKSAHEGQEARAHEAVRDEGVRAAWRAAVLQVQKLSMNFLPVVGAQPHASPAPAAPARDEPDNSLLVVRYEESVEDAERRREPPRGDPDSDDERLVIDETKKPGLLKCPYCDYTTKYAQANHDHILRHYNLKPYTCGYCDFTGYHGTMLKHLEKEHPERPRSTFKNKVPDWPPPAMSKGRPRIDMVACLTCFRLMTENVATSHTHVDSPQMFAKNYDTVLECMVCSSFTKDEQSMKEHLNRQHADSPESSYTRHKVEFKTINSYYCRAPRCNRKYKSIVALENHHGEVHGSSAYKYTIIPTPSEFGVIDADYDMLTEAVGVKRTLEDAMEPVTKRLAKKSTAKLPYASTFAKKSTTKLPSNEQYLDTSNESSGYSYYGTEPSLESYAHVQTNIPLTSDSSTSPVNLQTFTGIVGKVPKIVLNDVHQTIPELTNSPTDVSESNSKSEKLL